MKIASSVRIPGVVDDTESLMLDLSTASSTVFMGPQERLEALQRANPELSRKLMEAEQTLQNKLTEHELELEEMQVRLEEVRSELSATKREEKELRSKEVRAAISWSRWQRVTHFITAAKILPNRSTRVRDRKSAENAHATYSSLQKQYQEQCSVLPGARYAHFLV